jgi:hypothetical protein
MRETIKSIMEHSNNKAIVEKMCEDTKEYGWDKWVSGYPTDDKMKPLLEMILTAMPNIKIYPRSTSRLIKPTQEIRIVQDFYLYTDTCAFPLGHVGFKDYTVGRGEGSATYGVYSRKIQNAKYHDSREEFHMLMTSNIDKAFKAVKTYAVPYTDKELAKEYFDGLSSKVNDTARGIKREVDNLVGKIKWGSDKNVIEELLYLKSQGIKFKTEVFNEVANSIQEAYEKVREEESRKVGALFVHFRKVGDDMYADVEELSDVRSKRDAEFVSPPTTYLASELPEHILNGVSVLNILQDGQYVARIGQKIDNETFWLERG